MQNEVGFTATIQLSGENRLYTECTPKLEGYTYSMYLYRNGELVERSYYVENNSVVFWPTEPGEYHIEAVAVDTHQKKTSVRSETIMFEGIYKHISIEGGKRKRKSVFQSMKSVVKELWKNRERMVRVSWYDYETQNRDSYLGWLWGIINPAIQVGTYWFVFGIGIRGGQDIDGFPYLVWMLCGLVPWFFVSTCITKGAASVYAKANLVLRLRYPQSTLPVGSIITAFFEHVVLIVIMAVIFAFFGVFPNLYWFNLLYYEVYMFIFLSALALFTSTLTMIARDFLKLINALVRLLFFITPILWTMSNMGGVVQVIMRANPILYAVDGYRDSLIYGINFWERPIQMVVFWAINLVLFAFGSTMQQKYKDQFADML